MPNFKLKPFRAISLPVTYNLKRTIRNLCVSPDTSAYLATMNMWTQEYFAKCTGMAGCTQEIHSVLITNSGSDLGFCKNY